MRLGGSVGSSMKEIYSVSGDQKQHDWHKVVIDVGKWKKGIFMEIEVKPRSGMFMSGCSFA